MPSIKGCHEELLLEIILVKFAFYLLAYNFIILLYTNAKILSVNVLITTKITANRESKKQC